MYTRSKALDNLDVRMEDVQLLLDSHEQATQRSQMDKQLADARNAEQAFEALRAIVRKPGRGRPPALGALNRAAIVLLCAHLQGYFEDAYDEAADILLGSKVKDVQVLKKSGRSGFGNPHSKAVDALFASLGFPNMTAAIHWPKCRNARVKGRLKDFIELRNKIAHGERVAVRRRAVTETKAFVERLSAKFDERLFDVMLDVTEREPW